MRVVSCLNPQHITNPYTHEHLTVRCGKCRACRNALAHRWINKLEHEKRCWKYCYFVTLTYNNENLPRLIDNGHSVLVDASDADVRIPFQDLQFDTPRDTKYFNKRLNHDLGIPYCRVSDIQKFHKRLNKYIHDNITQKYKNFRYFLCSEYGKDTFRPHYHGLYFFNDRRVSYSFQEILSQTWTDNGSSKGRIDAQLVKGTATSYVAQYINMFTDLPSFYKNGKLKPFYVFSKQPSIGSLETLDSDISKLFFDCSPTRIEYDSKRNAFVDARIPCSLENRLYPRIPKYSEIPLSLRTRLYGLVGASDCETFKGFLYWLKETYDPYVFKPKFLDKSEYGRNFQSYLLWLTNGFNFKRSDYLVSSDYYQVINRLKRFYYISSRVCSQAEVFGISVFCYVSNIDKYYSNLSNLKLSSFYEVQERYSSSHDLEDIGFMYDDSDLFYQSSELDYVPSFNETFAFKDLSATSEKIYHDSCKTHFKNDYLDKCRDVKLSLILKDYFYHE